MAQAAKKNFEDKITRDRYHICPACTYFSHSSEHLNFCILCGTKMIGECSDCLEPILYPTAKYCPSCGIEYRTPVVPQRAARLDAASSTGNS